MSQEAGLRRYGGVALRRVAEVCNIGETDDYCDNIAKDPIHVHDLNATIRHTLGIDHTRLACKYQGRHFRLTDVRGTVLKNALA